MQERGIRQRLLPLIMFNFLEKMKKIILIILTLVSHLNLFSQEKKNDTSISCDLGDGIYRYYLNSEKTMFREGIINNCNYNGLWRRVRDNKTESIEEFRNGINFSEKELTDSSDSLLVSSLNLRLDTLVQYYYESKKLTSKLTYWIDKSTIPKNRNLNSELSGFVKKLVKQTEITYNPNYENENIIEVVEKENGKTINTKYYKGNSLNKSEILFEYTDYNGKWIHGNKKNFIQFMKKEMKEMKKEWDTID